MLYFSIICIPRSTEVFIHFVSHILAPCNVSRVLVIIYDKTRERPKGGNMSHVTYFRFAATFPWRKIILLRKFVSDLRPIDFLTEEIAIEVTGVVGVSPALWYFRYIARYFWLYTSACACTLIIQSCTLIILVCLWEIPCNYFPLYFSKERAYTSEGYRMFAFLSIDVKRDLIGCLR